MFMQKISYTLLCRLCLSIRNCIKRAPKSTVPGQHRFGFEKPRFCSLQSPDTAFFVTIHGTNHCTFGDLLGRPFTAQWAPNHCSSGALLGLGYGALLRALYPDLQNSDTVRMAVTKSMGAPFSLAIYQGLSHTALPSETHSYRERRSSSVRSKLDS